MTERRLTGVAARIDARIPRPEDFRSDLRGPGTAARAGTWLGVAFGVCFLTGLYSHLLQDPVARIPLPTGPARLYQVTQGVHVAAGTAAVPLLLVKLWSVFPRLFERPPRQPRRLVLHLLEKGSIALLVGAAVFQLVTGLANSAQWYPWSFGFRQAHFALAWVAVGSILLHVAVKLPAVRAALGAPLDRAPAAPGAPSRRTLLRLTGLSAVVAVVATTAAEVPGLRRLAVLAVRSGDGPQGVPVNRSAVAAGVAGVLEDPAWRLRVVGPDRTVELSLDDLRAMPQHEAVLPIACVEGWSASGTWGGVPLRDVVALVGATAEADVVVRSLQSRGAYRASTVPARWVAHEDSLLALTLAGEPLHPDHGYPCRLIAPARPGVLQTKWLREVEVVGA
ncbi:molybdopterin-dependent oxidoreductase [uncultured Phycicoccus sp.]|uniref:molybdopterin-dependent oxidoreductase n=1 Tax=uncultured Phycicoccus sp. TaxID=661422 RepID=UPI002619C76C|nr:molybdopterin-dependent oxidoreductase [uncultured Phycicoccus sp.]